MSTHRLYFIISHSFLASVLLNIRRNTITNSHFGRAQDLRQIGSVKTAIFRDIALFEERNRTTIIAFPPRKCYQWLLVTIFDCLGWTFDSIGKRAVTQKLMEKMLILRVLPLECVRVTMHWSIECPQQSTPCYHECKEARKTPGWVNFSAADPCQPMLQNGRRCSTKSLIFKLYACTMHFYRDKYSP